MALLIFSKYHINLQKWSSYHVPWIRQARLVASQKTVGRTNVVGCWRLAFWSCMTLALTVLSEHKTFSANSNDTFLITPRRARTWLHLIYICSLTWRSGLGPSTSMTMKIFKLSWLHFLAAEFYGRNFANWLNALASAWIQMPNSNSLKIVESCSFKRDVVEYLYLCKFFIYSQMVGTFRTALVIF